jgi:hypothetical protein
MWTFITTYMQEIAVIAAAVSAVLAFFALLYTARQLKENSLNLRRQMYLDALSRYSDLRQMILDNAELGQIYEADFDAAKISSNQELYIHILIAFCEGLYLTKQINAFKDVTGGDWANFIRHTLSTPAVRAVWEEQAKPSLRPRLDSSSIFERYYTPNPIPRLT